MPDISAAGTYDKETPGLSFLRGEKRRRTIMFLETSTGSSIGTSVTIKALNDAGHYAPIPDGSITAIPAAVTLDHINKDLQIVVVGTPDFNITSGD